MCQSVKSLFCLCHFAEHKDDSKDNKQALKPAANNTWNMYVFVWVLAWLIEIKLK